MTRSGARFWLLLLAALVVVVLLIGGSGDQGPPLDPRSVSPDGTRGLVETLDRLGISVQIDGSLPDSGTTAALLLQDRLSVEDEEVWAQWVNDGGTLVVADRRSGLDRAIRQSGTSGPMRIERQLCTIDLLRDVETLVATDVRLSTRGFESCFGNNAGAFVVAQSQGQGTVVSIGSPDVFTNALLDEQDSAVLAVALLTSDQERPQVTIIAPSVVPFGDQGLGDLVAPRIRNSILQLLAAFLLYALFRGRRLGKVVPEPVPVRIASSEIIVKAGLLSERAKDPASAAGLLRADTLARARSAMSIPTLVDDTVVVQRIASRTGIDADSVGATLLGPVQTEADLVAVSQNLLEIDERLYGELTAAAASSPSHL